MANTSDKDVLKCIEEISRYEKFPSSYTHLIKSLVREKYSIINDEIGLLVGADAESDIDQIKIKLAKIFHIYIEIAIIAKIPPQSIQQKIDKEYSLLKDLYVHDLFALVPHMLRAQSYSIKCIETGVDINTGIKLQNIMLAFTDSYLEAMYLFANLCCSFNIYQKDIYKLFYLTQ